MPTSEPCEVNFNADLLVAASEDEPAIADGCFSWVGGVAAELRWAISFFVIGSVVSLDESVQPANVGSKMQIAMTKTMPLHRGPTSS